MNNPIGVMDSGVGGLTVLKALRQQLPHEDMVYVGDEKHCPYGVRTPEEISQFVEEIAQFLIQHYHIKMFVIACNTASAFALPAIQEKLDIPVIGMIDNGSLAAVQATKTKHIALLATEGTVKSQNYTKCIHSLDPNSKVTGIACQEFVRLIEEGAAHSKEAQPIIQKNLAGLKESNVDTIILGCTHFPLIQSLIQSYVGEDKQLIDAGEASAKKAAAVLQEQHLLANRKEQGKMTLLTTGTPQSMMRVAHQWIEPNIAVQTIEVK